MDGWDAIPEAAGQLRHHGGNINAARRLFPDAPQPWIDLSTGINPLPYPVGGIAPETWARLPEPSILADLEEAARLAYGTGAYADIVAAPGTQALIQWLPHVLPARRVGVLGFTYSEHAACWQTAGAAVATVPALSDLADFDVGVVVNPNNPDGRLCRPAELAGAAHCLARRGGLLIVDEAFMDVLGAAHSLAACLPEAGAVVLRSFGKMYGLAGLRLGFAIAPPDVGRRLRQATGPWAVSSPAIEIGRRALRDTLWRHASIARLHEEADDLDRLLRSAGFSIVGGTPLFRLARHPDAGAWFGRLCRAGILVRPFGEHREWLRFGIPHRATDWDRLRATLANGDCSRRPEF